MNYLSTYDDNQSKGAAGEFYAHSFLLRFFKIQSWNPIPDEGIDAHLELRKKFPVQHPVHFRFQIKTENSGRFTFKINTLKIWEEDLEYSPVFLFHVDLGIFGDEKLRYLNLFKWRQIDKHRKRRLLQYTSSIDLNEFKRLDDLGQFYRDLIDDYRRVSPDSDHPDFYRASVNRPMAMSEFSEKLHERRLSDPDRSTIEILRNNCGMSSGETIGYLKKAFSQSPLECPRFPASIEKSKRCELQEGIRHWRAGCNERLTKSESSESLKVEKIFRKNFESWQEEKPVYFTPPSWLGMQTWRSLCAAHPNSFKPWRAYMKNFGSIGFDNRGLATAMLLGVEYAKCDDRLISESALDVLHEICKELQKCRLSKNAEFVPMQFSYHVFAELGEDSALKDLLDFNVKQERRFGQDWDAKHILNYYNSDPQLAIDRTHLKLTNPNYRHFNTRKLEEERYQKLLDDGLTPTNHAIDAI